MSDRNPIFDINRLAVIGAVLTLLGDFIALLITYQDYCEGLNNKNDNSDSGTPVFPQFRRR